MFSGSGSYKTIGIKESFRHSNKRIFPPHVDHVLGSSSDKGSKIKTDNYIRDDLTL